MSGSNGGVLKRGNPGNTGGGRPTDEFKRRMRELASRDKTFAYLDECLSGKHGPQVFLSAFQLASDRAYGKVPNAAQEPSDMEPLTIILKKGTGPFAGGQAV